MKPASPPRYAIFATPEGPLARFGAGWLGWDSTRGVEMPHPEVPGLDIARITARPRTYGLHATLKPPFHLARGCDEAGLIGATEGLAASRAPVVLEGLRLARIGGFLALVPLRDETALQALAAACVQHFEPFRAPLSGAELDRRRSARLSDRQEVLLHRYGYPYVMDEFRFHITLTGSVSEPELQVLRDWLEPRLEPLLPSPFRIDALTLLRSDALGRFHRILHATLAR